MRGSSGKRSKAPVRANESLPRYRHTRQYSEAATPGNHSPSPRGVQRGGVITNVASPAYERAKCRLSFVNVIMAKQEHLTHLSAVVWRAYPLPGMRFMKAPVDGFRDLYFRFWPAWTRT